ncbi:S41 family peptidase [Telluribacter humicola]|uniref:S41 family peptidase n=1 Tax=Telluribacter humicola TaxID=1720261 RepID=UPI001A96D568|nr:S41 family peptidase [Telluribacter humicola]
MKKILTLACLFSTASFAMAQQGTTSKTLYEQGARWNSPVWESTYKENLTEQEKLAGLSLVWSEAKYNFAFFDKVPHLDWDSLYVSYIPKVQKSKSTVEYYLTLQEMFAQLNDGHTGVYPPMEVQNQHAKVGVVTALVEGKVLVLDVVNKKLAAQGVQKGLEITHINGEEVHAFANRTIRPYVSSNTEQYRLNATYGFQFLLGKKEEPVDVTFRTADGKTLTRTLKYDVPFMDFFTSRRLLEYRMLPGNVAYVVLNSFHDEKIKAEFDSIYPQLKKAGSLILDVRENGGGNSGNGWDILARLTNKNFPLVKWESRNYQPVKRAWGSTQSWFGDTYDYKITNPDTTDYFHGPVVVLSSSYTFSAAEDFLSSFRQAKRGLIIGEPSGGSTGQPLFFRLPGGGSARICAKRDYFYDGTEWVGTGIQPDVYVAPTIQDVRAGRDTALQKALEVLSKKNIKKDRGNRQ